VLWVERRRTLRGMAAAAGQAQIRAAEANDLGAITAIFAHYVTASVSTFEETPPTVGEWEKKLSGIGELGLPFLVVEAGGGGAGGGGSAGGGGGADDGGGGGDGRGARVAGYAYAGPWRPKAAYRHTVEDSVYLAPGWTGRGLGRMLLTALLDHCARAGARQMIAVIADSEAGASVALHRACGFTDAGRLAGVGFKHGRWIDTLLLQRGLAAGPG
jgi:L-amino acid N-acyltransferase YncA